MEKKYLIQTIFDRKGIDEAVNAFKKLDSIHSVVGANVGRVAKIMNQTINYGLDAQGKRIKNITTLWMNYKGQLYRTQYSLIQTKNGWTRLNNTIKVTPALMSQATAHLTQFQLAMRRVLIVVPIWFVMRQAFMAFIKTLTDGARRLETFSDVMMKVKAVTHDVVGSVSARIQELRQDFENLAIQTGKTADEIAKIYYQFGTIGLPTQVAQLGTKAVTRFALATQEKEVEQLAKTIASAYKLLGNTIDKTIPKNKQLEVQLAKLYHLWTINAGESKDLRQSLANFLPVASTMNLTFDQTIALLATLNSAALLSGKGGRLLRTSFLKLSQNVGKASRELGIYIGQNENAFDSLMKVLSAIKKLDREGKADKIQKVLKDIFGGVRGSVPIRALIALYDLLNKNLDLTTKKYDELGNVINEYNSRIEDVESSTGVQIRRFREIRTQLGHTFLEGITGAEGFAKSLDKINNVLIKMKPLIKSLGELIRNLAPFLGLLGVNKITRGWLLRLYWGQVLGIGVAMAGIFNTMVNHFVDKVAKIKTSYGDIISKALEGKLEPKKLDEVINALETKKGELYKGIKASLPNLNLDKILTILKSIKNKTKETLDLNKKTEDSYDKEKKIINEIDVSIKSQLALLKEKQKYIAMSILGYDKVSIAYQKLYDYLNQEVKIFNELDAVKEGRITSLRTEELITMALNENWQGIKDKLNLSAEEEKKLLTIEKLVNNVVKERLNIVNKYASGMKSTVADALKGLMKGELTISDFFNKIKEKAFNQFATALSDRLTTGLSKTGIFGKWGSLLAGVETEEKPIVNAGIRNAQLWQTSIEKAGINVARMWKNVLSGQSIGNIAGGGVRSPFTPQLPTTSGYNRVGGFFPSWIPFNQKLNNIFTGTGGFFGNFLQGAMLGAFGGGREALLGGLTMGLTAINPVLGFGAMLLGGLFGHKKRVVRQSSWTPQEVKEMFPNLGIEIAPPPNMYPLPESRYFQTNINIHIDRIEGENRDIAETIANTVDERLRESMAQKYIHGLTRAIMPKRIGY